MNKPAGIAVINYGNKINYTHTQSYMIEIILFLSMDAVRAKDVSFYSAWSTLFDCQKPSKTSLHSISCLTKKDGIYKLLQV